MRKYLVHIAALLSVTFLSCAQKKQNTTAAKQDTVSSFILPEPKGWVSDFENLLSPDQVNYLDSVIGLHEKETGNQIAFVCYSPDTATVQTLEDFEKFSLSLFKKWGIGEKDKDNGIGILVSRDRRMVRIDVGFGLESKLSDAKTKWIIDSIMIPRFKEADYFRGASEGILAIIAVIK